MSEEGPAICSSFRGHPGLPGNNKMRPQLNNIYWHSLTSFLVTIFEFLIVIFGMCQKL